MSLGTSEWLCLPFSSDILHRITLGILFDLTMPQKEYQKPLTRKKIQKCLYFWTSSFPRVPGSTIPREWEKKNRRKIGRKRTSVLYNTHNLILLCWLLAYQQQICHANKVYIKKILFKWEPDFKFQLSQARKQTDTGINTVKGTHSHFQFGDTCSPQDCNRIGKVLQRRKQTSTDLVEIPQYNLL